MKAASKARLGSRCSASTSVGSAPGVSTVTVVVPGKTPGVTLVTLVVASGECTAFETLAATAPRKA